MFDFQEWNGQSETVIRLDCLSDAVKNLDLKDSVTKKPLSNLTEVDFYLPDLLMKNVFVQLAKSETDTEESPDQLADRLNKITDQISTPELKSSTILSAVVTEILQNHHPLSEYEVKISDG
jgi:hypothetical protein